jgi:hypothetical protein
MNSISVFSKKSKADAGTIAWFNECVSRAKNGVFAELTTVTPGLASAILQNNEGNRHIQPMKALHYASDMIAGRWALNGEPVIISRDGQLNDGQHRMGAVIEANRGVPMLIVFGVDRETRKTVDQGAARSAADYLSMDGVQYANNASTIAKWVMAYEASEGQHLGMRARFTNAEIVQRVRADNELIEASRYGHKHYKYYRGFVSLTAIGTAYYILSEICPSDALAYLDQICLGEGIKRGDPAFAVRTYLQGLDKSEKRNISLEAIFHGWNKYRSGSEMKIVRINKQFPALV